MTRSVDNRRFFMLAVIAVIGDMLLLFSFTENTADDIIGLLLSAVLATLIAVLFKVCAEIMQKSKFYNNRLVFGVICVSLCLVVLITALYCVMNFSNYASNVMLGTKEILITFVSFSVLVTVLGFSKKNILLKLSLLLFSAVFLLIIFMFAFSTAFMEVKYLIPYKVPTFSGSFSAFLTSFPVFLSTAVPLTVIGIRVKKRYFALSYVLGIALTVIAFINILSVFGSEFASTLEFPYSKAVSTASLGHIFSRLDIFLYCVCFFTCLIKASVCVSSLSFLTTKFLNNLLEKN